MTVLRRKAILKGDIYSVVKCEECGAESGMVKISKGYSSDEKAIEKWNRRADNEQTLEKNAANKR
ncbi:MAG: Lar family restriction alleviation protein [Oscillospiraceae bacterium]